MGRKVQVEDGESIDQALRRLRMLERRECRCWTKKRYGYHEKPSMLHRREKKRAIEAQRRLHYAMMKAPLEVRGKDRYGLRIRIGLGASFARTGPNNAIGS